MLTLTQALAATPWRLIALMGRARGLTINSNLSKADLIQRVSPRLLDPASVNQALARLSPPARVCLARLLAAGGQTAARYLTAEYGPWRANRPIIQARQTGAAISPLEQLHLGGLVFRHQPTDDLFIPADLIPLLPVPGALSLVEGSNVEGPPPDALRDEGRAAEPVEKILHPSFMVDLLCHDLAYLLALLWRDDVSPLHSRWLPPLFLAQWGQACAVPPACPERSRRAHPQAKSELQTGRRRFIHYLAESAGFLPTPPLRLPSRQAAKSLGDPLALRQPPNYLITPSAWLWLTADRSTRLKILWDAWLAPDPDRWRAFRLPGFEWLTAPLSLLSPLHAALTQIDPADPAVFAQTWLAQQPGLVELVPSTLLNPAEILTETVIELLTGPLVWLTVLSQERREGSGNENRRDPVASRVIEEDSETPSTPLSSPELLRLTPQGRAWLTGQPLPDNDAPVPPAKFTIQTNLQPNPFDSTLTLTLPGGGLPDPADLVVAVEVGSKQYGVRSKGEGEADKLGVVPSKQAKQQNSAKNSPCLLPTAYYLLLTSSSFIRCLHRGWSAPALLDALNRLAARPLSAAETALLCAWAAAAEKMTLRHAVILETTDPAILTRLASTRRGRALIQRTLSPRAVIVNPARLDQLTRRLTEQEGVPPKTEVGTRSGKYEVGSKAERPTNQINNSEPKAPCGQFTVHNSQFSHLWLAAQVYRRLGRHLRLPARIPQAALDSLSAHLTPTDLAAADIAAEQVMAALRRALDGELPFPAWGQPALPPEQTLAVIERALAAGQNLNLLYYSPATDTITRRVVEPYRLEQRGDLAYLVGFCQHAQAERMFRLDRVREIELVERK